MFNWLIARAGGGHFMLRIEDTDPVRSRAEYVTALQDDLHWLGLEWDEGPGRGGPGAPYYQSQRRDLYNHHLDALIAGGHAYPCFCSDVELEIERKTQAASGRPPRYSGKCRALTPEVVSARLARGDPATLRFRIPENGAQVEFDDIVRGHQYFRAEDIGDFVIRRSDGQPTFFFTNAVDDALMGVSLVIRGEDHLTNTPRQIFLLHALGLPVPRYGHIALVLGASGAVLSKRDGAFSVRELRDAGYLPLAIVNYLARLGHTYDDNALLPLDALARAFDSARLHKAPAHFDATQLLHWQRLAVQGLDTVALWSWLAPAAGDRVPAGQRDAFVETIRGNVVFPGDARDWAVRIFDDPVLLDDSASVALRSTEPAFFSAAVRCAREHRAFADFAAAVSAATQRKGKALYQPLRAALTGATHGPEMPRLFALLGAERAHSRLVAAGKIANAAHS